MYLSRHACIVVSTCLYQRTDLHRSVFGHVQISINPSTRVIIYQNQCSCNPHRVREVFENCLDLPVLTCIVVGIYYGLTIIIVSLATGMTVFTLNIHHKGLRGHPVSPIIRKIFFGVFARVMCVKMDGDYNRNSSKVMVNFLHSYFFFFCV